MSDALTAKGCIMTKRMRNGQVKAISLTGKSVHYSPENYTASGSGNHVEAAQALCDKLNAEYQEMDRGIEFQLTGVVLELNHVGGNTYDYAIQINLNGG